VGFTLIQTEFNTFRNLTTVSIIMAHEFGHCVDNEFSAISGLGITKELFADYLAGCFFRYRSALTWTDINGVLYSFFSKGDDLPFNDSRHHGTNTQRLNAIKAGWNWYNDHINASPSEMVDAGKEYLGISSTGLPERSQSRSSYSSASSTRSNIRVLSPRLKSSVDGNVVTYTYTVRVYNWNKYDATVVVGGLVYGHFPNCTGESFNFVKDGEFEDQTVSISAEKSATVEFQISLNDYHPVSCAGVKPNQAAKVVSAEKD